MHLIWQALLDNTPESIQHSFLTYTANKIKKDLEIKYPQVLQHFKVDAKDRKYQIWKRNSLGIELCNHNVFIQKLDYMHWNPVKAGICKFPEEYYYSSAKFYEYGIDDFGILTHYNG